MPAERVLPPIDYFEDRRIPFAVAINQFPGGPAYPADTVREALTLPPGCPIVYMDARAVHTSLDALVALVEHALALVPAGSAHQL